MMLHPDEDRHKRRRKRQAWLAIPENREKDRKATRERQRRKRNAKTFRQTSLWDERYAPRT